MKKIPIRTCIGCGMEKPKKELIRIVKTPEGEILLDAGGRKNGRGAYVCPKLDCFVRARKAQRFQHSLEAEISDELMDALEKEIRLMEAETARP